MNQPVAEGANWAERRDYFRVDDRVSLAYRPIADHELAGALERLEAGYPDKLSLASAFAANSTQMRQSMESIRRDSSDVAAYLEGLNKKLDLLVQLLAVSDNDLCERPTHAISLSASGLSFATKTALDVGQLLEIKLLMFPSYHCVVAFGSVVHCLRQRAFPGGHRIGVEFNHIRENDRDLIVRHVTQKQSAVLREARVAFGETD